MWCICSAPESEILPLGRISGAIILLSRVYGVKAGGKAFAFYLLYKNFRYLQGVCLYKKEAWSIAQEDAPFHSPFADRTTAYMGKDSGIV